MPPEPIGRSAARAQNGQQLVGAMCEGLAAPRGPNSDLCASAQPAREEGEMTMLACIFWQVSRVGVCLPVVAHVQQGGTSHAHANYGRRRNTLGRVAFVDCKS